MKKLILIMGLLLIAAPVMGAGETPTPTAIPTPSVTPTPVGFESPTPIPNIIPDGVGGDIPMTLTATFTDLTTAAITAHKLISDRTGADFTVPAGHRFYVTGISWSLQSAVIGTLFWDGNYMDTTFDTMYAPYSGQGKVIYLNPPVTSLDAGVSPKLTTDRGATGWVAINGVLR